MLKYLHQNFIFSICCLLLLQISCAKAPQAGTTAEGQYYTSFDGIKIYYEVKGSGQPVILLHGFTNTLETWKSKVIYDDLVKQGFQVVVLDLRGNGKSDKPETVSGYEQDAEARDVMGLATDLGFENYQLVGYSRGSIIAARLLVLDKRITAAVLGGMGEEFTNPEWPRRIAFYKALSGEASTEGYEGFLKSVEERGLHRQSLAFQQQAQPSTPASELAQVNIPVLTVSGQEDNDNGSAEALAAMFPNGTSARVPGVHNTAHRTQEFSDQVIAFLKKHKK